MPWNKGDVIAKRKELVTDAGDQLFMVSTGEICAPNGTLKQDIAHPGYFLRRIEEHNMTWCMPRAMINLQGLRTHGYRIALLQPAIRNKGISMGEA